MNPWEISKIRDESMAWKDWRTVDLCDVALGDPYAAADLGITQDEAIDKCRIIRDENCCAHLHLTRDGRCANCGVKPFGMMGARQAV